MTLFKILGLLALTWLAFQVANSQLFTFLFGLAELAVVIVVGRFLFARVPVLGSLFGLLALILTFGALRAPSPGPLGSD